MAPIQEEHSGPTPALAANAWEAPALQQGGKPSNNGSVARSLGADFDGVRSTSQLPLSSAQISDSSLCESADMIRLPPPPPLEDGCVWQPPPPSRPAASPLPGLGVPTGKETSIGVCMLACIAC